MECIKATEVKMIRFLLNMAKSKNKKFFAALLIMFCSGALSEPFYWVHFVDPPGGGRAHHSSAGAACLAAVGLNEFPIISSGSPVVTIFAPTDPRLASGACNSHNEGAVFFVSGLTRLGDGCPENAGCFPEDNRDIGEDRCSVGNPISPSIGNKYQAEDDYIGAGFFPLVVSRRYNSAIGSWRFSPEIRIDSSGIQALVIREDGKKILFNSDGQGGWVTDLNVTGLFERLEDNTGNTTGWRYTTLDQQIDEYDATGRLTAITHRSGFSHTYTYTATDITVTNSEGGVLTYQLDTTGRITGFTDPDNNQYTYSYDTEGRLTGITYPNSGGTRIYHYEDTNISNALTGITDANGDRFATWTYDSQGRAVSSSHHNGSDLVTIGYDQSYYTINPRATVTNPLGKQTTYHFAIVHGVRKITQVEGHPSNNLSLIHISEPTRPY